MLIRAKGKAGIKVIDFGSGTFRNDQFYTYIQSLYYRAPEIVLSIKGYSQAIDMWSYGCILFELYTGVILFHAVDGLDHFSKIVEVRGVPPKKMIKEARCQNWPRMFRRHDLSPIMTTNSRGEVRVPGSKSLRDLLRTKDRDFEDYLDKLLQWDKDERMNAEQALSHPFITKAVTEIR